MAGAVAAVSTVAATETAAAADGDYGSGELGDWSGGAHSVSTDATIRAVCSSNGVVMFGDSIANQDAYLLATRLHETDDLLAVDNWNGRPTTPAVTALADWNSRFTLPKRILMATGTNDIFNPPVFAAQVDRTMAIAGASRIVIWVNAQACRPNKTEPAVPIADQRNSGWINLQLADAQKRHPNLRIVHWAEFLAAQPARLTTYLRDGVHTSLPLGQNARNELIVQALNAAK